MLQALNPKHPIWCSWTSSEVFLSEWNWSQQTTAALRRKSQSGDEMNLSFPFLFSFQWKLCKVPTEEFSLKRNKTWTHFRRNLSFLFKFFSSCLDERRQDCSSLCCEVKQFIYQWVKKILTSVSDPCQRIEFLKSKSSTDYSWFSWLKQQLRWISSWIEMSDPTCQVFRWAHPLAKLFVAR